MQQEKEDFSKWVKKNPLFRNRETDGVHVAIASLKCLSLDEARGEVKSSHDCQTHAKTYTNAFILIEKFVLAFFTHATYTVFL